MEGNLYLARKMCTVMYDALLPYLAPSDDAGRLPLDIYLALHVAWQSADDRHATSVVDGGGGSD